MKKNDTVHPPKPTDSSFRLRRGLTQIDLLNKGGLPLYCLNRNHLGHKDVPPKRIDYLTSPSMIDADRVAT